MSPIDVITTVVASVGGSAVIVAGLATWLGKVWADRIAQYQTLLQDIDIDLRKRRIEVYDALWKATPLLPKWPINPNVTYEDFMKFSKTLRGWYFETGGMYLSNSTHAEAYSPLQEALEQILSSHKSGAISDKHYEEIRDKCSTLRTALARDIESRRDSASSGSVAWPRWPRWWGRGGNEEPADRARRN